MQVPIFIGRFCLNVTIRKIPAVCRCYGNFRDSDVDVTTFKIPAICRLTANKLLNMKGITTFKIPAICRRCRVLVNNDQMLQSEKFLLFAGSDNQRIRPGYGVIITKIPATCRTKVNNDANGKIQFSD